MLRLTNKYPGKRAFVTGAATGIGKSFCNHLAKDGWTIGMADINVEKLEAAAEDIRKRGGEPIIFSLDVSDRKRFEDVAEKFLELQGGIDLLVNNAGIGDGSAFHEYSLENWDWMIGINQMGVLYGCYFFVPAFRKQGFGTIMNIASAAGFMNAPKMAPYNMTKAAVISLSETLYYELAPMGVHVAAVMPTFIKTEIMSNARGSSDATKVGRKMVQKSKLLPDEAVLNMLKQAGKEKTHILVPKQSKRFYWLKRHFPGIVKWQINKIAKKQFEKSNNQPI